MAIFAIPNPKKSTIVDFPVDRIKISVKNIPFKTGTTTFTFQGWDSGVGVRRQTKLNFPLVSVSC